MAKVIVKKIDIKKGVASHCQFCPIALALKRRFPKLKNLSVSAYACIYIDNRGQGQWVSLSKRVINFIERFDDTGLGEPFEFRIAL